MARIRTIKPDFFRHSGLYRLEKETGLPIRVAFAGLWTAADREGRFRWDPDALKLDALPYDDVDFSRVLDALTTRGHIRKYASGGREYGCIPSWNEHQVVNNRESASVFPSIEESEDISSTCTREPRDVDASATRHDLNQGEGKGREGKGKEGNGVADQSPVATSPRRRSESALQVANSGAADVWIAYSAAYRSRYGAAPVRNAKVNGQLAQLVARLGAEEATPVAAFYVGHQSAFYVRNMHGVGLLLQDAEKLRTEWATGQRMTSQRALQMDRTATNGDAFQELLDEVREASHGK